MERSNVSTLSHWSSINCARYAQLANALKAVRNYAQGGSSSIDPGHCPSHSLLSPPHHSAFSPPVCPSFRWNVIGTGCTLLKSLLFEEQIHTILAPLLFIVNNYC